MKKFDEKFKELKEVAPELSKLDKKNFGEVPVNYFTSFSDAMMAKLRKEELAEVAPTLAQLEKVNTLKVPANYFKAFPQQMLKKISAEQKTIAVLKPNPVSSLNNILERIANVIFKPKYSFAIAGMASMVVVIAMLWIKPAPCTDLDCKLASLSTQEINSYLENTSDAYSDEVFETTSANVVDDHPYTDAMKDISDAELNKALLN